MQRLCLPVQRIKSHFGKFNGYTNPTYDGLMDNIRIYNRALNTFEINTMRIE